MIDQFVAPGRPPGAPSYVFLIVGSFGVRKSFFEIVLALEFWLHFPGKHKFRLGGVAKVEVSKNLVFQTPLEDQRSSEIRTKVLENPDDNPDDNPDRPKRPGATPSAADSVCFASPPRLQLGCTLRGEGRIF